MLSERSDRFSITTFVSVRVPNNDTNAEHSHIYPSVFHVAYQLLLCIDTILMLPRIDGISEVRRCGMFWQTRQFWS